MNRLINALAFAFFVGIARADVDTSPLDVLTTPAFEEVIWTGWAPTDDAGQPFPFRAILLTHAGTGDNLLFVPDQRGIIHIIDNKEGKQTSRILLDISAKVAYQDKTNEEGLLGLTFHPKFAENGFFFVYYTNRADKHQNVVARFQVDPKNPDRAQPESEKQLLILDKPFWNHDGGTIVFGPDGMLYIAVGDGGLANDPFGNGQNLGTLLGSILRIDVDRQDEGKSYAVPADNPFVDKEGARPEIWAYGLRNVWRMAFDAKTGLLWAGDVGQDLWEEIDIIEKGGNYGWNLREGKHRFGSKGVDARPELKEPIWEYHHNEGKSITGGFVYRGKAVPQLEGAYLYADYVSTKVYALWYDPASQQVTANRQIRTTGFPVLSFGEDQQGEAYLTAASPKGKPLYRLVPSKK
jgi:glucose/arabinose dehydrogenase